MLGAGCSTEISRAAIAAMTAAHLAAIRVASFHRGCAFKGQRPSISFMISSAHRTASEIAATVAGIRLPPSCWASLRAARIAAMIPSTRLRCSSTCRG